MSHEKNLQSLLGRVYSDFDYKVTAESAILYSLTTGATNELPYTYEKDPGFQVFPTMATAIGLRDIDSFFEIQEFKALTKDGKTIPEILLHGEEEQEIRCNLVPGQTYRVKSIIKDITDKGKLTIVTIEKDIISGGKEVDVRLITRFVLRGIGSTGFKNPSPYPLMDLPKQPEKPADIELKEIKTLPNQNAFYRLNGDKNLIHIDPKVAAAAGFDRPILHGLCTYAISARAVSSSLEHPVIEKIGSRFTSHVFPGETLSLNIWKVSP